MVMNSVIGKYESDLKCIENIIDVPPLGVHGFILNLESSFKFLSVDNVKQKFIGICNSNINKNRNGVNVIPKIIHRVWLCSLDNELLPEEKYLATIKATAFNLNEGWEHYVWVNSILVEIELKKYFADVGNVTIKNYCNEKIDFRLKNSIALLIKDKKFAFACDKLRIELIYNFGGIYSDVGVHFKSDITCLLQGEPYVFLLGNSLFFQNSLFGAKKHDPLFDILIRINQDPGLFPRKLLGEVTAVTEGYIASGLLITYLYLIMIPDYISPVLFCGNQSLIQWGSQRSWYGNNEATASVNVKGTKLSFINKKAPDSHSVIY